MLEHYELTELGVRK